MKTANVPVGVTNMKFTYFAYQHEKESIPANVPVSMEVTHFCEGSRDPTPSTIPGSWSTSTKSSKIRTTHGHHSRPAPAQACPCPSPCHAPCMARTCIAPFGGSCLPFPFGCGSLFPLPLAFAAPSLQCPEQWCAWAARQRHQMSSQQRPSLRLRDNPPLMGCRCPGAWPVALALPFALSGLVTQPPSSLLFAGLTTTPSPHPPRLQVMETTGLQGPSEPPCVTGRIQ